MRPRWAAIDWFEKLLKNEFLTPAQQRDRERQALATIAAFAASHVPHYRDRLQRLGLAPDAIRDRSQLPLLPALTRADVVVHARDLVPATLPGGQRRGGVTRTSGTTGQPVQVEHTVGSLAMFGLLKQREFRWFRFDPAGTFAQIRLTSELPGPPKLGETCRMSAWPLVGDYFETGRCFGYADVNPIAEQVEWVERHRPNYLLALSGPLEHLALAFRGRQPLASLRGTQAISHQVTPGMRQRIEEVFGVPVHENYGLNEVGVVATRCPEGDRYHVHAEHCLVEIVDAEGRPCRPGEMGRLLVTTLLNPAMPLLRYDTDDWAEAVDADCPCGRTLPAFGRLLGRYRRIAELPPGTWERWMAIRGAFEQMPSELARPLRQFQVHQRRDGTFHLRIVSAGPVPPEMLERLRLAWQTVAGRDAGGLEISQVSEIPRHHGRKFQDFTSDFFPAEDSAQRNPLQGL